MQIFLTFGEILQKYNWEKFCEMRGLNPYMIKEGLANSSDSIELTVEEFIAIGGKSIIKEKLQ